MPFVSIQFLPTRPSLGLLTFLIGREKSLCIFSLTSTSLSQSSLTARGRKLYVLQMVSGYWETLFHLYKNPVYIGKTAGYRIDSCYVEGIRNKEFRYPRRASHNTVNALEMERHFAIILVMQSDRDLRHTIQVEKHSGKGRRRLGVQAS